MNGIVSQSNKTKSLSTKTSQ